MSGEIRRVPLLRDNFALAEGGGLKAGRYAATRLHDADCYRIVSRGRCADCDNHLNKAHDDWSYYYFKGREANRSFLVLEAQF